MTHSVFPPTELVLIGCGSMGYSLLKGWLKQGLFQKVIVSTPRKKTVSSYLEKITWHKPGRPLAAPDFATKRVFCLAVKPYIMTDVLNNLSPYITSKDLILSVAAGLELSFYENQFTPVQPLIRVMPNTPTAIGQGFSGLLHNKACTPYHKNLAEHIFGAVGETLWVDDDDKMDRLTTISGCGPAYIFALVEAFETGAKAMGFNEREARHLARSTVEGSAAYLKQALNFSATDLKNNVARPGGMTEKGLQVLQDNSALNNLIIKAFKATYDKAQDLKQ